MQTQNIVALILFFVLLLWVIALAGATYKKFNDMGNESEPEAKFALATLPVAPIVAILIICLTSFEWK